MKKKISKKKKPAKQKIDVVIESLVNLEQRVKELIKTINQLDFSNSKYDNTYPEKQYWPNHPHKMIWNPPKHN
jgi:hypothetical protein